MSNEVHWSQALIALARGAVVVAGGISSAALATSREALPSAAQADFDVHYGAITRKAEPRLEPGSREQFYSNLLDWFPEELAWQRDAEVGAQTQEAWLTFLAFRNVVEAGPKEDWPGASPSGELRTSPNEQECGLFDRGRFAIVIDRQSASR
jgi:hypothetical protein